MYKSSVNKISLAASAMLLCAGLAQATTPASPITATPSSVSISYTLPSTAGSAVPVVLTIPTGAGDAYVVDPTTVPYWLSIDDTSDVAVPSPGLTINFVASSAASSLTAGVYQASVHVRVTGFADLVVPVSLAVADVASTLSVTYNGTAKADNSTVALTWVYGSTPLPTATLNVLSSDSPVAFSTAATTSAPANTVNWIQLSAASAIAYNYGTGINLTFLPDVLQNAAVGDVLTGQATISYGSGPTVIHINVTITVGEPVAALATNPLFPAYTPKHGSGGLTVVVTGSGFGTVAQGYTSATTVKISYGTVTTPVDLTTITSSVGSVTGVVNVVNPNTMILTIPWEDATPVSILNTAQDVTLTITNGLGGETAVTAVLHVTTNPIVYTITDGGALIAPASGVTPKFAPYEMISVFGDNFGPTAGTPVIGALDGVSRYPSSLTAGSATLTVHFYKQDGTTLIGDAPVLFVSNNQINAMVPSGVTATGITGLVISVASGSNLSAPFTAAPGAANPGIFTVTSTGQGQGAILLSNFSVNSSTNKAAKGSTVVIYATGLGTPNSTATDTAATTAAKFPGSCISVASYVTAEAITSPATADGAVLVSSAIQTNKLPPCFTASPTVTIGGLAATVTYAGWVSGSVTGLYQINATVPTKAASGDLPVLITMGGVTSQAGVTVSVQ